MPWSPRRSCAAPEMIRTSGRTAVAEADRGPTLEDLTGSMEMVPSSASMSSAKNFPALRILVVDDEALIRWSLAETLVACGHDVAEAADAATAVSMASAASFDVVFLDLRLPDSSDLTLLSKIRHLAPRTRVILMTAYGTSEVSQGAMDLGACRVVTKPLEMNDVAALASDAYGSRF
jgi:CheY-like chemotaxis protein